MLAFASGQAAITGLLLAVLRPGDTVALPSDGYFTVRAFAEATLRELGVSSIMVPTAGPYPSFDGVRLVLLETPANPGLDVCDIRALSAAAHAAGALVAVDNTTATPLGQRPLDLGADLAVASGTKALTGHSDVLLGYVATRDDDLLARLTTWRSHDRRGARRVRRLAGPPLAGHAGPAAGPAERERGGRRRAAGRRSDVDGVRWPGRPGDPSYAVAAAQMRRIPGIVSFDLGSAERVARFLTASALVFAATSFGGVHTTADRRAQWGDDTSAGFVRLSCGIEDTADLLADLAAALDES